MMKSAIDFATRANDSVLPNPKVGAVIEYRGKIVGAGYHHGPGHPHAEVEAVRDAKRRGFKNFKASTLYVNLEPCCHLKKRTPPCVPLLIQLGFKKIFIAHLDPNPQVSGQGIQQLRKAKIKVEVGICEEQALQLNQAFLKNQLKKMPYVTLKIATTFDGKMADDFGQSKWITGEQARTDVHRLRLEADAIGVGAKTVEFDRPHLNIRLNEKKIARKVVVFGTPRPKSALKNILRANHKENLILLDLKPDLNAPQLRQILRRLYREYGICHLMIEGGARLASSFLKAGLVDQFVLYLGRGLLGGSGAYSLGSGWGLKRLKSSIKFRPNRVELLGHDVKISGSFNVYRPHSKSR